MTQCGLGGIEIGHELHARHVERFGGLVEVVPFAVLRDHVANIEERQLQHVAQVLLVLIAVQPPHRSAAVSDDLSVVRIVDRHRKVLHQLRAPCLRKVFVLRRHLALFDAVVNANPPATGGVIVELERQSNEIESALSGLVVMALEAGPFEERRKRRRQAILGRVQHGQRSQQQGGKDEGEDGKLHVEPCLSEVRHTVSEELHRRRPLELFSVQRPMIMGRSHISRKRQRTIAG